MGGNPVLLVMGRRLMFRRSWTFSQIPICCKNYNVCLKRQKINGKRDQGFPIEK